MSQANSTSSNPPSTDEEDKQPSAATSTSNGSHHHINPPTATAAAHSNPQRFHIFGLYGNNNNPHNINHTHQQNNEDQSSFHYLSEPSLSEDHDDSTTDRHSLRSNLLSPMEGTDEDEDDQDQDVLNPPPPPPAGPPPPRSHSGEELASPGNTSISSWESHFRPNHPNFQRVKIHFSPELPQASYTAIAQQYHHLLHPHQQQQLQQHQHQVKPYSARKQSQQQQQQQPTGTVINSTLQQPQQSTIAGSQPPASASPGDNSGTGRNAATSGPRSSHNSNNKNQPSEYASFSGSDVASKDRGQLENFWHQLRQESAGALTESLGNHSLLYTDDSASDRKLPATRRGLDSVVRGDRQHVNNHKDNNNNDDNHQHHRISSVDTELMGNTSDFLPDDVTDTGQPQQQRRLSALTMDDTINMTLSASDDDEGGSVDGKLPPKYKNNESRYVHQAKGVVAGPTIPPSIISNMDDHTQATPTQQSSTDEDDRHTEQHSADDEKTNVRPPRIRTNFGPKPAHRRTRSGDSAAAKLATGGLDWIGMDKDRIPFPDGDDDDDDDDVAQKKERHSPTGKRGNKKPTTMNGHPIDAARFSLGSAVAAAAASRAAARRHRREHRQQQRAAATLRQQILAQEQQQRHPEWLPDMNIYAHYPPTQGPDPRHLDAMNDMNRATNAPLSSSLPDSTGARIFTREESGSSAGDGRGRTESKDNLFSWLSSLRGEATPSPSTRKKSLLSPQWSSQRVLPTQPLGEPPRFAYRSDPYLTGQDSFGFLLPHTAPPIQGPFQRHIPPPPSSAGNSPFLPTNNILVGSPPIGLNESKPSPIQARVSVAGDDNSDPDDSGMDVSQNQLHVSNCDSLEGMEQQMEAERFRPGSYQHVLRTRASKASPFVNFGRKVAERAKWVDRSAFLPTTSILHEKGDHNLEFPTYQCPRCGTLQREFFTVSSAPRQYETAAGYLALYFAIYVIASLYIFGLEEGWPALDCIYFAVITLTTAGLGDYVPTTSSNKIICSIFIYFGVACIGLLLGSYIASMLDESSRREARQNRLDSCPNCTRLQNIKDAAERRQLSMMKASARANGIRGSPRHFCSSERTGMSTEEPDRKLRYTHEGVLRKSFVANKALSERFGHSADDNDNVLSFEPGHKKIKRRHEQSSGRSIGSHECRSPSPHSNTENGADANTPPTTGCSTSEPQREGDDHSDQCAVDVGVELTKPLSANDHSGNKGSLGAVDSSGGHGKGSPPRYHLHPKQASLSRISPPDHLGSPMTHQILGRQNHTRHTSIDVGGGVSLLESYGRQRPNARRFTHDSPSNITPTIREDALFEGSDQVDASESKSRRLNDDTSGVGNDESSGLANMESFYSDDFDSSDDSSVMSSSESTSSEKSDIPELSKVRVKTAKYVVLTLRQALVNSMVIIAVGCLGFWFIEGFTFVDSWYFTTVLLTTVGYGDIVPVTKGGKLFATVYILVAGTILLNNMSLISMIPLELRKRRIERAVLTQFGDLLDDDALRELASGPLIQRLRLAANRPDGLHECSREMFALAMLVRLGKVTEQDVLETFAAFRRLDVNNDGVLNSRSIIAGMIHRRRIAAGRRLAGLIPVTSGPEGAPPPPPIASPFVTSDPISTHQPHFWTPTTHTRNTYRDPIPNNGMESHASETAALLSDHNTYDSVTMLSRSQ